MDQQHGQAVGQLQVAVGLFVTGRLLQRHHVGARYVQLTLHKCCSEGGLSSEQLRKGEGAARMWVPAAKRRAPGTPSGGRQCEGSRLWLLVQESLWLTAGNCSLSLH